MAGQSHHVIPVNRINNHPLFDAISNSGRSFDPFTLILPDKASAAAAEQAALFADAGHQGRHRVVYDEAVDAYLDAFEEKYVIDTPDGMKVLRQGSFDDLVTDLRRLETRLGSGLIDQSQ